MSSRAQSSFHIFYTKDLYKKKKVYKEGFLFLSQHTGKIFDEDGVMLTSFKHKHPVNLQEEYTINNYLITIDRIADLQSFKSGAIFIRKSIIPLPGKYKKFLPFDGKKSKSDEMVEMACGLQMEKKIYQVLRPHQKEGVEFMFKCLWGTKDCLLNGCILADFMGLGKTLQTLALCYSVLKQKLIKKFVIVSPLTLLDVWEKQSKKWLQQKVNPLVCNGDGAETTETVKKFVAYDYRMLIISYQTFYRNIEKISGKCDLIIFDEGHRMKNKKSKLLLKLKVFKCEKRILLTGTPIQNNLQQLYTCVSVINPRLFGNETIFRNVFQKPILEGLNKKASFQQKQLAKERTGELARQIKQFSLRRTADVLKKYLPAKTQHLIFVKLTELQNAWYKRIVDSKKQKGEDMFQTLNSLRKLFVHPRILKLKKIDQGQTEICQEDCNQQFSYKLEITLKIVQSAIKLQEKTIIVSYYTETLDFIALILKERGISYAKLDGRQKTSQRKNAVINFEKQSSVLLLSGKAGGTGLTLICATRMIMIEPDWNPSNDSQVMGRIWRQGQERQVHIYRLVVASTFEQKMLERQKLKKTLANNLIDNKEQQGGVDFENIGKLFMENKNEVQIFKKTENELNDFFANQRKIFDKIDQDEHGIIFVRSFCSCNQEQKGEEQKDTNQFTSMGIQNFFAEQQDQKEEEIEDQQEYKTADSVESNNKIREDLKGEKKKKQKKNESKEVQLGCWQKLQQKNGQAQQKRGQGKQEMQNITEVGQNEKEMRQRQNELREEEGEENKLLVVNYKGKSELKDIGENKLLRKIKKK